MIKTGVTAALRYPGAYIVIDGSQAGLSGDIPSVLLVGQKLASGSAPAGEITLLSGVADAVKKAGAGSMLAQMAKRYRNIDPALDLYMLPYADLAGGVQATSVCPVTTAPTEAGVIPLYIAGYLVSVGVAANDSLATVAAAIATAINASADAPVTASANAANLTLTAKHKGTCGNNIDLRFGLYGEKMPTGLAITLNAMSGGVGDPAPGDLTAILGPHWYRYVALGINDAATLAAWGAESKKHYLPPIQAGFRCFTAHRGDYAAAVAFGTANNHEHISDLSLELNPISPWESAAIVCAAAAPALYNSPAQSLEGIPLTGMVGVSYHDWTNANSLLFKGMSIMQVAKDGTCSIKRLISMYQFRPDGSADDAFLDINTAELNERIRYEQRMGAIMQFTGTSAAKSNEGYEPGLRITTADDVRAFLLSLYQNKLMRQFGWVQEYAHYKSTLLVEQDPTNPSRFNFKDEPVLLSPYYILAGVSQFRKAV
jgi:phage tail sheath gpL-like